jgi:putative phosphoesterase
MKSSEKNSTSTHRIGVLSDTHGLLRPEVINALKGVDQIIHAGDLDTPEILKALEKIAPITAVKGNMDRGGWTRKLQKTEVVEVGNHLLYVLHNIHALDLDPEAAEIRVVIFGHSHMHSMARRNGVLYLNPGGAGYRRFNYPISLAILSVYDNRIEPRIIELDV